MLEPVFFQGDAGLNLYAAVWNTAGEVLDFSDATFKAIGSATTPYIALTERTNAGGAGKSHYTADLDLDDVGPGGVLVQCAIVVYEQAGGSPAPLTDSVVSDPYTISVRFGMLAGEVFVDFEISVKSTAGLAAQISAWLVMNGQVIPVGDIDAATELSVVVREHGAGVPLFTATGDATDIEGNRFEIEQSTPNFTDDRQYSAEASITVDGEVFTSPHILTVQGA